jgi:hypothetical protein
MARRFMAHARMAGAGHALARLARTRLRPADQEPGTRASWDDLVVRTWHVIAFSTVALVAAACTTMTATTTARPSGYPVPLRRIVADANVQNQDNPSYRLAAPGTKVPMSEATAARAVISECNEGGGTRVLVAGLVIGPVTSGSSIYWAIFVDPPGKHIAPSTEPVRKPVVLNWIGAFVSVKTTQQPFCDFGRAANLPPLPVFGS